MSHENYEFNIKDRFSCMVYCDKRYLAEIEKLLENFFKEVSQEHKEYGFDRDLCWESEDKKTLVATIEPHFSLFCSLFSKGLKQ